METPQLGSDFFLPVSDLDTTTLKTRWYMCVIVNLSSMNYPDVVPEVWQHLSTHLFPGMSHDEKFQIARKVREALTKAVGIVGAAKTGTTMRTLAGCVSDELKDTESLRALEDPKEAEERGMAFHKKIYGRNPNFNPSSTVSVCPDYAYIIRSLFYGRIFSFDAILDDTETGFVIIAALFGIDCQLQLRNHMIGMLINGAATREDLAALQDLCLCLARRLGVMSRTGLDPKPIPTIPNSDM